MDSVISEYLEIQKRGIEDYQKHLMLGGGTPGPVLLKGKGVRVEDVDGKSYIDCTSQSWALYLGYSNKEIIDAVSEHAHNYLTHIHQGFGTLPRLALAKKLSELAPGKLNKVSFTVGGGPAIEAAMKIAHTNRPASRYFICLYDAYHGTTLGTMGSSWISTKASGDFAGGANYLNLTNAFIRVPNPYCYRCYFDQKPEKCNLMCAKMLKITLERGINGPAAGVIVEPIQASAGQIPCPRKYLAEIRKICDEFEVPLIFDEVQTYCRIGRFFAADYYGITPDIIALGKGLGSGFPIAAIIVSEDLKSFGPKAEELHTFANTTIGQVAALKQIEIIQKNHILENTNKMGNYICSRVSEIQKEFPEIGDIRGTGLHIGIEFVKDPVSKVPIEEKTINIRKEGLKRGVIFGLGGVRKNVLKIKPPLIIDKEEADEVISIFYDSIKTVLRG
ncbi:aminotransferase class III-fold pyridoxal phosphate-dependent enzyme [bacterium]|nr:aminotransferase class III-fold pyridoxal phosphate-dependent enzyme [bacterium]